MTGAQLEVLLARLHELAVDVGRLRRRFAASDDELSLHLADRVARHVEALYCIVEPSAGELVAWNAPGDEEAVAEAIRVVDARWRILRGELGRDA